MVVRVHWPLLSQHAPVHEPVVQTLPAPWNVPAQAALAAKTQPPEVPQQAPTHGLAGLQAELNPCHPDDGQYTCASTEQVPPAPQHAPRQAVGEQVVKAPRQLPAQAP